MTDKITIHPLKQKAISAFSVKWAIATLLSTSILVPSAHAAEQEWWFDVEVILFKRNVDAVKTSEKFKQSRLEQPNNNYLDVLSPYLKPDVSYLRAGLPYCRASNRLAVQTQYEQDFAFPVTVAETNKAFSAQSNEVQEQQADQGLVANSNEVTGDSFQYKVATTDIFAESDDSVPIALTNGAETLNLSKSEQNKIEHIDETANIELAAAIAFSKPPIQIKWIEWQIPNEALCSYAEQIDPSFASITYLQSDVSDTHTSNQIKRVPEIIEGMQWLQKRSAFLLPTSNMDMRKLYEKIKKQNDITPILHLNWRQEVTFGRDNGQTFRLFAGENYAKQFDSNGLPVIDETVHETDEVFDSLDGTEAEIVTEDLFTRIDAVLADDTPIGIEQANSQTLQLTKVDSARLKEIWQIDGTMNVYLRNVGRVPYLHIDSNLDFRQPIFDQEIADLSNDLSEQGTIVANQLPQPNFLQSANFNQLRRVISKQVHYFDHPLFGMIVRIKRYKWPVVKSDDI